MKLIAGLGNPGKEYEKTRHNSGFMAMALLAEKCSAPKPSEKFNALVSSVMIDGEKVLLMEPLTFMNLSGSAVSQAVNYYHIDTKDILIMHDDMDLPVGSVRIRKNGSSGGQKGMKNIIDCLGTDQITRIRIGVGHSARSAHEAVPDWVLSPVPKTEQEAYQTALQDAADAAYAWVSQPLDKVMNAYNIRVKESAQ